MNTRNLFMPNAYEPLIVCENLVKIYKVAALKVVALQGRDLIVRRGGMTRCEPSAPCQTA